eukprot:scaffold353319_cov47-Attheya_sp.AAC.1
MLLEEIDDADRNPDQGLPPLDPEEYLLVLDKIGAKPSTAADSDRRLIANKKKVVQWLGAHRVLRPYFYESAPTLKRLANELDPSII